MSASFSPKPTPITGPGIPWAQQWVWAHFDKVAAKLDEKMSLEEEEPQELKPNPTRQKNRHMKPLIDYVSTFARRGACKCGRCGDAPPNPEEEQPEGHTADTMFFEVSAAEGADADTLKKLISENKHGQFCDVDVFDGKEHNYIELGGWIGDQGLALMLMGLGAVLGIWKLLTPKSMLGDLIPKDMQMQMAGGGMVSIQAGS